MSGIESLHRILTSVALARRYCAGSCARGALTTAELLHAPATRSGDNGLDKEGNVDLEICLRCCQGLVAVDNDSKIIRFVHYTARGSFDQRRLEYFPNVHIEMTDICLTYLNFDRA